MNGAAFIVISVVTLAAALAAATLPNLMHAAFYLVLALLGLASFFFLLGAEFVGLALVFIYIGAVAVLIVFTILLTRRDSKEHYGFNWSGVLIALAVFTGLTWSILKTQSLSVVPPHIRALTVKQIGQALMTGYVWPLQCVGLLSDRRADRRARARNGGKKVRAECGAWGAHGCTVLVSAFCGNELPQHVVCLRCDNESSRSPGGDRQHARGVRSPDARCTAS